MRNKRGFTFIEILIAMTIIAVTFIPLMRMFAVAMENIYTAKVMTTAVSIGREHMERIKNLNLPEERLKKLPSPYHHPPKNKPPMEINNTFWRVKRIINTSSDPVKVDIFVYEDGNEEPLITLSTLFEDIY
ncbi:MAG: prepilin-type N-terminal cleavage/methylation domain-containing protein [Candidatus Aureabacteria bacterium]|nr:prepilin-type N-terminal cleavage/methylation domain-containing protein [Candidatus Auribacterota bacterium]